MPLAVKNLLPRDTGLQYAIGPPNIYEGQSIAGPSDLTPDHVILLVNPPAQSHLFSHISVATDLLPLTYNVAVIIEFPYTDLFHSQNNPTVPSTLLIPPINVKDVATDIIGVKVLVYLETVKWSNRFTTVLPCI
ncbi:uncharacterized protein F5891DRAFT_1183649 [Suillus fuscotomentosus]|uniref:Uncharacterized protein n=1 Tax=Suillus fuscotomentosus TaxID=1912939 RepID=A0AAD4EF51_9AGAM|nr:uncharacterized protein F5891DRAFT_1183649 [Suillus fuscotomentosus]KAG1904987.1 hypothetical protein F5891DRAFT_1183649 [Suillus fuscotomentosus]